MHIHSFIKSKYREQFLSRIEIITWNKFIWFTNTITSVITNHWFIEAFSLQHVIQKGKCGIRLGGKSSSWPSNLLHSCESQAKSALQMRNFRTQKSMCDKNSIPRQWTRAYVCLVCVLLRQHTQLNSAFRATECLQKKNKIEYHISRPRSLCVTVIPTNCFFLHLFYSTAFCISLNYILFISIW